jgi:hypothetical protein
MSLKPYDEVKRQERRHVVVRSTAARAMDSEIGVVPVNRLVGRRVAVPGPVVRGVNAGVGVMGGVVLVVQSEPNARLKINPASKPPVQRSVSMRAIAMAVRRIVQMMAVLCASEFVGVRPIGDGMGVVRHLVLAEDVGNRAAYRPETP